MARRLTPALGSVLGLAGEVISRFRTTEAHFLAVPEGLVLELKAELDAPARRLPVMCDGAECS
jgi:hypothetical protein